MRRKGTTLLVILLCFLIAALIGLGIFMTWLTGEQDRLLHSRLQNIQTEPTYSEENGTLSIEDSYDEDMENEHQLIFIGDSRTVGMEEAVRAKNPSDRCTFIGKVGEGYYWLINDGLEQLDPVLEEYPDALVIINLGVNDLKEIDSYLDFYPELFNNYPEASFYIMSVNPVSDDHNGINNEDIEAFNAKIQDAFPGQYLNCYSYLKSEGFKTADGLHYTYETYLAIHYYAAMMLAGERQ